MAIQLTEIRPQRDYHLTQSQQVEAIQAALGKINEIMLDGHLHTCVTTAIRGDEPARREAVINEILEVFRHN